MEKLPNLRYGLCFYFLQFTPNLPGQRPGSKAEFGLGHQEGTGVVGQKHTARPTNQASSRPRDHEDRQ